MLASALYAEVYLICIIIVVLLLLWNRSNVSRSTMEQWLAWVYISFLICFAGNFLFKIFNDKLIDLGRRLPLVEVLKAVYYFGLVMGVCSWCGYAVTLLCQESKKRSAYMYLSVLFLPAGLIVTNFWTHLLFIVTERGDYRHGPLYDSFMLFLILSSLLLAVQLVISSFREFDPSRRRHKLMVASFPLSLLCAWLLTLLTQKLPVVCVAMMLEVLYLYVGTNRQQISMDKLTQVNNRQNLVSFINYKLYDHVNRLYLMMIDVDYFKTINDNFGHLEGDNALVTVANTLKRACAAFKKRPFIARYGGDEFIVVLEGTQEDANQLCDSIRAMLNEDADRPYKLSLSIGMASYRSGMTAKDMIAAADDELYKIKQARDTQAHH